MHTPAEPNVLLAMLCWSERALSSRRHMCEGDCCLEQLSSKSGGGRWGRRSIATKPRCNFMRTLVPSRTVNRLLNQYGIAVRANLRFDIKEEAADKFYFYHKSPLSFRSIALLGKTPRKLARTAIPY